MKAHSRSGKRREIKGQALERMWTERRLPTEVVVGGSAVGRQLERGYWWKIRGRSVSMR